MIADLLPSQVASAELCGDDDSASLFPEEAAEFGWAVESRRREFTSGRSCARRALAKLGLPPVPILRGPRREPLWPPGVAGSITHCRGYRAAAVAKQSDLWSLGIDAEVHDELPAGVREEVLVEEESVWLKTAPGGIHWDRVLFSAKESVFKAWYPLTCQWLGFEDVAVAFDPAEETFSARLLITPPVIEGLTWTAFPGRFLVRDGLVLTATALTRAPTRCFSGHLPRRA